MRCATVLTALVQLQAALVYAQGGSKGRPPKYICPQDDGLKYTTPEPNAVTFELKCGQGTTAKRIDNTPKDSQKECAIHCSEHPNCQSADYNSDTKNCARFSEYIPTIPMEGVNTWFPIEERKTQDPKPQPQQERTNQCPRVTYSIAESQSNAAVFTADASCENDDGKIFASASGIYMKIRCNAHPDSLNVLAVQDMSTLTECLNYCGDTPGCQSASWEGGRPTWNCRLYSEGEDKAVPCVKKLHDMAFIIDPPTIESPDDPIVLCSTECPLAHGQIYDTTSGERFKMSCCARHGVQVIGQEPQRRFSDCMDACGRIPSCQSVDWQQSTGICYFGKHSGDPAISVSGWSAAYSIGCAGACSSKGGCCGGGGPTPDQQPGDQVPMIPDGPLPPPKQCGNQGIGWAQYKNAQGAATDAAYSQFRPEVYKTLTPNAAGVTSSIGGIKAVGGQKISVYGDSQTFDGDYFALDHTGYLYAATSGKYKFTVSNVDDLVLLWTGAAAVSGWSRNNAVVVPIQTPGSHEVDIQAGQYMPFRIMFVQAQGGASFSISIEGPDGQMVADSTTQSSPWVVQYSCDGSSAPRFPPWGQES